MKCANCGAAMAEGTKFCPQCGTPLGGEGTARPRSAEGTKPAKLSRNDPEIDVWAGSYSPKAMIPTWVIGGVVTLLLVVGGATVSGGTLLLPVLALVVLLWVYLGGLFLYRRVGIHYRLTTQRFFHEKGILRREVNRVEVIDMDDISFSQGLMDRLLGVGSITITSSDRSDPNLVLRGIDQVREIAAKIDDVRRKERLRRGMFIESV